MYEIKKGKGLSTCSSCYYISNYLCHCIFKYASKGKEEGVFGEWERRKGGGEEQERERRQMTL
jgi:hypothetical protein